MIYEQCVRTFWHEDRYKNDLRYLKVWLEYVGAFHSDLTALITHYIIHILVSEFNYKLLYQVDLK